MGEVASTELRLIVAVDAAREFRRDVERGASPKPTLVAIGSAGMIAAGTIAKGEFAPAITAGGLAITDAV